MNAAMDNTSAAVARNPDTFRHIRNLLVLLNDMICELALRCYDTTLTSGCQEKAIPRLLCRNPFPTGRMVRLLSASDAPQDEPGHLFHFVPALGAELDARRQRRTAVGAKL